MDNSGGFSYHGVERMLDSFFYQHPARPMKSELFGYGEIYRHAVETLLSADPKVLCAVHELLFSGYAPLPCDTSEKACKGNWDAVYRFSGLVCAAITQRSAA